MAIGKDFWEYEHAKSTNWLTGTDFTSLLTQFKLTRNDIEKKRILEIGIGHGRCTKVFGHLAKELYCCDISETGLEKIKYCAKQVFQTTDLKLIPPVDLAISHLVLVHCTDEEMLRIINDVNLAEGGRFMFQVSGLKNGILTDQAKKILVDDGSHFFRSVEETKAMIDRSNKQFVSIIGPNDVNHEDWFLHQWYYITVENKI